MTKLTPSHGYSQSHRVWPAGNDGALVEPRWVASAFVWTVWAVTLAATLTFVASYGNRVIPHGDELYLFGGKYDLSVKQYADNPATPTPSLTLGWVWEQHAEHRIPLAKFVWLAVLKLTNFNFFIGNVLVVLAFGAMAACMVLTARSVRGWTSYADAFLPLSILNPSQAMDYLWWFCIHHVLPSLLATVILMIVVSKGTRLGVKHLLVVAVCIVLLSLSGPGAFPFVLAFAAWIGYWALCRRDSPEELNPRWLSGIVLCLTGLAVVLMVLSFLGFDRSQAMSSGYSATVRAGVKATLQLVSLSLGTAGQYYSLWKYLGSVVVVLAVAGAAVLGSIWRTRPEERPRALGLFLFLAATATLIAMMSWARGAMGEGYVFVGHYVPRIVPALCCLYFVFVIYGGRVAGGLVSMGLFTISCALLWPNVTTGLNWGSSGFAYRHAMERDLRAGLPPLILAERYGGNLGNDDAETIAAILRKLKRDGIGEFRNMQSDPAFLKIPVPIEPISVNQVTLEGAVAYGSGNDPYLTFAMKRPEFVYAIRVKLSYTAIKSQPSLQVYWRQTGKNEYRSGERTFITSAQALTQGKTVTVWVNDTIDEFRIDPDSAPCVVTISDLTLLVHGAN